MVSSGNFVKSFRWTLGAIAYKKVFKLSLISKVLGYILHMDFLFLSFFAAPLWIWLAFFALILSLLAFDLGVLNKKDKVLGFTESLNLTLFYILIAVLFGGWVYYEFGAERALPYFTAYVVEKSLSLDNIFVISIIFGYYAIPLEFQHRVLFWGILGVLVLRGICIALGTALVSQFSWLLFIFGFFLIYTGFKIMFTDEDDAPDLDKSKVRKWLTTHLNVTDKIDGHKFFVKKPDQMTGELKLFATPLFLALVTIELADLLFAVDSIPAVLSITQDTFIVFTSNIFAILGLRAMYFMLATLLERFKYLKYALSLVLVFIGAKIFYNQFIGHISPTVSLTVTLTLLIGGGLLSFMASKYLEKEKSNAS